METFTILGERNSGTHFLEYAIKFNFHLKYEKGMKHFYGHTEFPQETLDTNIYFCIVRDPIDWIDSLFKRLHHIPAENKKSIDAFINNEWYSIYEEGDKIGKEIIEDRHIVTKERYANIFEMRRTKHDYFLNTIQEKVKHYYIIQYEDLMNNYETILNDIKDKFKLRKKAENFFPVPKYKGTFNALYAKKPIVISDEIQEYIKSKLDLDQERQFGYLY